tara:strand:- start:1331 stop:1489 length:159 start_codon:yes stop_codon:yes gene_type:complete
MRGAIRHVLTAIGPLLASRGVTTDADWQIWTGLAIAVLGFYDSWTAKEKRNG